MEKKNKKVDSFYELKQLVEIMDGYKELLGKIVKKIKDNDDKPFLERLKKVKVNNKK